MVAALNLAPADMAISYSDALHAARHSITRQDYFLLDATHIKAGILTGTDWGMMTRLGDVYYHALRNKINAEPDRITLHDAFSGWLRTTAELQRASPRAISHMAELATAIVEEDMQSAAKAMSILKYDMQEGDTKLQQLYTALGVKVHESTR